MLTFFRRRYRTAGAIIYRNRFHTDLFEGRGQAGLRSLIRLVSHNGVRVLRSHFKSVTPFSKAIFFSIFLIQ